MINETFEGLNGTLFVNTTTYETTRTIHALNIMDGVIAFLVYIVILWVYEKAVKEPNFLEALNKNAYKPEVRKKILSTLNFVRIIYPIAVVIAFAIQIIVFNSVYG